MRSARREAMAAALRRRRRRRLSLLAASVVLIGGGLGIAYLARDRPEPSPTKTRQPDAATGLPAPTPKPVACGAKLPDAAGSRKKSYSAPRDQSLDPDKRYLLRLQTSCGDIAIELDVKRAPKTSNSVAFLARERFYDGLVFHRIVPGFVIQGGDPRGDGSGGPGYNVVEAPPKSLRYEKAVVAMAKGGTDPPGSGGSQFFIVSGPDGRNLPAEYALLGKVVDGTAVVAKIETLAGESSPSAWAYIERATVVEE